MAHDAAIPSDKYVSSYILPKPPQATWLIMTMTWISAPAMEYYINAGREVLQVCDPSLPPTSDERTLCYVVRQSGQDYFVKALATVT